MQSSRDGRRDVTFDGCETQYSRLSSHFGTHYSSSMIVCGFMIRLSPFTEIFLALQVREPIEQKNRADMPTGR